VAHDLAAQVDPGGSGVSGTSSWDVHAEQLHSPRWAGSMIDASLLRDIDRGCGILSSDIAADAMPAGMSWGSSATSCQWSWWLMSLT
jgi:hypothetical protein